MLMAKRRFWRAVRGQVDFDIHMHRRTLDEAPPLFWPLREWPSRPGHGHGSTIQLETGLPAGLHHGATPLSAVVR
jgi:hypothetical protein